VPSIAAPAQIDRNELGRQPAVTDRARHEARGVAGADLGDPAGLVSRTKT
jgi:hypothetical protein